MKKKFDIKRFLLINIGIIILAIGLYFFLIPANLAVGGVTGLAMVLNKITPLLPIGIIMFITNIILFVIAFIILGKEFVGYTIYSSLLLSGIISILEIVTPLKGPFVDDLILNLVYGIVIQAIGMAIILNQGTSTGGTDIIAKIINKYTGFPMGQSLLLSDILIVLSSIFVFGLYIGMYALLGMFISSAVIDKFIAGFNTRIKVAIISEKEREISAYINNEVKRGVTLLYGAGGFSNSDKRIINTVVSRREYMRIKNYVKELDPKAFIWVSFVNEVLGEGFSY
nr:YitT family protein [Tissierella sp.]